MGKPSSLRRAVTAVAAIAAAVALAPGARGDWPVGRHDSQRTGAAAGRSDIRAPEEIWRYYLGGSLGISGLTVLDVDGDGVDDYIMVAGGSLIAKGVDDRIIWSVPARAFTGIAGVADLDGAGGVEVVVNAAASVTVVEAATGTVRWELPAGTMKQWGSVRIGDVDGDQLADLTITEAGACAAVPGTWPGAVYGFAGGFGGDRELWAMTAVECGKGTVSSLFDADGDGDLEVLESDHVFVQALDGASGALLGRSPDMGAFMPPMQCRPVEADGTPGEELACFHSNPVIFADRSVMLLDLRDGVLEVVWRRFLSNIATGEMRVVELAVDLDGTGRPMVVASARDSADLPWTTFVLDGATGTQRGALVGELVAGSAPRPGGGNYLLTISEDELTGWRSGGSGPPVVSWRRTGDESPVIVASPADGARGAIDRRAAVLPGASRLVVVSRTTPDTIRALDLFDGGTTVAAEVHLPPGVRADTAFVTGGDDVAFAMSRSDGYLAPFDAGLVMQVGVDVQRLPRTGGHVATGTFRALGGPPRSGDLDGDGRDEIVVSDSRGALVRLDTEDAALRAPPRPPWTVLDASFPAITHGAAGTPVIAHVVRDASNPAVPVQSLAVRDAGGALVWSTPFDGPPMTDIVTGNLDGDGVPDLVVQWGATDDLLLRTFAVAGNDGDRLWEDTSDPGAGRAPAGATIGPWPGQSRDVVLHVGARHVWALAGATGSMVAQSPDMPIGYFLPTMVDVDADPAHEVTLTGGYTGVYLLDDDLAITYASPDQGRPFPYGSIARCNDGAVVLASEALAAPPRLLLTTLASGASGMPVGTERARWLAGGGVHATEAAAAAAGQLGQLTSSTSHEDLTGLGRPSTLVGSSDGWLYAVDPCAGTLDFSIALGSAVGEAVYGDGDGDGKDEILVTAGDGYLRALQHHSIDAPAWVNDLDPPSGSVADVDTLPARPTQTLGAQWAVVPGALSYRVAVVDSDGDHVLTPAWRDVTATEFSFPDLSSDADRTLFVLVRAVGAAGLSVDAASDGVTIVAEVEPEDDVVDGGCCDSGGGETQNVFAAFALLAWLSRRSFGRRRAARRG